MPPSVNTNESVGNHTVNNDEKPATEPGNDTLTHGLSGEEVHRRALEARKLFGKAQKALGFWIREIDDRKIYRDFACSNIYQYGTRHLFLEEHTIAEMLRTGKALETLPILSQAYEKGEISSTHVREVTRVATPETESFWCEAAKKSTTRQIEKLVAFSPKGGLPPTQADFTKASTPAPPYPEAPSSAQESHTSVKEIKSTSSMAEAAKNDEVIPHTVNSEEHQKETHPCKSVKEAQAYAETPIKYHDKLILELSGEQMAVIRDALNKARKESGLRDRASLLTYIARAYLAGTLSDDRKSARPPYQILLHHHLPSGLTWSDTLKGEAPVSPEVLAKALCDAEILEVDEPESPAGLNRKSEASDNSDTERTVPAQNDRLQYVNELYKKYKAVNRKSREQCECGKDCGHSIQKHHQKIVKTVPTISSSLRKKVLKRDGHKCQTPGCGGTCFVMVHHIDPQGEGGVHEESNLVCVCSRCHALIHEGKLIVEGKAPHQLIWRDERGQPL